MLLLYLTQWVNFKKVVSGGAGTAALSSMPCGPNNQFLLFHPSNSKSLTVYEGSTGAVAVKLDAHFEGVCMCVLNFF